MKRNYTYFLLLLLILFSGCSKDILKSYDTRIVGTWRITDVDRIGLGGSTSSLPFTNGTFTFNEDGTLHYVNAANVQYEGNWDIVKKYRDDETTHTLQITAVDYNTRQVLAEFYDDMNFTGTNHFKARVVSTFHTYSTDFKR